MSVTVYIATYGGVDVIELVYGSSTDYDPPVLSELSPPDNGTAIPADSNVFLKISDAESGINQDSVILDVDRGSGWETMWMGDTAQSGFAITKTVIAANEITYDINPDTDFGAGITAQIRVRANDTSLNQNLLDQTYTFDIFDPTDFIIATHTSDLVLTVDFDEALETIGSPGVALIDSLSYELEAISDGLPSGVFNPSAVDVITSSQVQLTIPYTTAGASVATFFTVGLGGAIWKFDPPNTWTELTSGISSELVCIHGTADGSFMLAGGTSGVIIYSTDGGDAWSSPMSTPQGYPYIVNGLWVFSVTDAWAVVENDVGGEGEIWHWNGVVWSTSHSTDNRLYGIFGVSPTEIYVASAAYTGTNVRYWNGTSWTNDVAAQNKPAESVVGSSDGSTVFVHHASGGGTNDLYTGVYGSWSLAVADAIIRGENTGPGMWLDSTGLLYLVGFRTGGYGVIKSWDGVTLTTLIDTEPASLSFAGVYGASDNSILTVATVGTGGTTDARWWDGATWNTVSIPTSGGFRGVWAGLFPGYRLDVVGALETATGYSITGATDNWISNTSAPYVTNVTAIAASIIDVTFDRDMMDNADLIDPDAYVFTGGLSVSLVERLDAVSVRITLSAPMSPGVEYFLTMNANP